MLTKKAWNLLAIIGRFAAIGMAGPIAWAVYFYNDSQHRKEETR